MAKIQIRRDTAANWTLVNPILSDGEIAYDKTNKVVKIGDGSTPFNSLQGLVSETPMIRTVLSEGDNTITISPALANGTNYEVFKNTFDDNGDVTVRINNKTLSSFHVYASAPCTMIHKIITY